MKRYYDSKPQIAKLAERAADAIDEFLFASNDVDLEGVLSDEELDTLSEASDILAFVAQAVTTEDRMYP